MEAVKTNQEAKSQAIESNINTENIVRKMCSQPAAAGEIEKQQIAELAKQLKKELVRVLPEYQVELLSIIKNMLPFKEIFHIQDVNIIGGVAEYAKLNPEFETGNCVWFEIKLKGLVKLLWKKDTEVAKKAIDEVIESLTDINQVRADIPKEAKRIFEIFNNLDLKTKILIGIGDELVSMSGYGVDTYEDMMNQYKNDCDNLIEQAKQDAELSKDEDLVYLIGIYKQACIVNSQY